MKYLIEIEKDGKTIKLNKARAERFWQENMIKYGYAELLDSKFIHRWQTILEKPCRLEDGNWCLPMNDVAAMKNSPQGVEMGARYSTEGDNIRSEISGDSLKKLVSKKYLTDNNLLIINEV